MATVAFTGWLIFATLLFPFPHIILNPSLHHPFTFPSPPPLHRNYLTTATQRTPHPTPPPHHPPARQTQHHGLQKHLACRTRRPARYRALEKGARGEGHGAERLGGRHFG
ncbi:MAG: hypothetical protein Q9180_006771 [Flavoplaca navasiana]